MRKRFLLVVSSVLFTISPAFADDDLRCPKTGKIVHEGDSQYEVEAKCGAPSAKAPFLLTSRNRRGVETTVQGEDWTYDFGPNAFIQKLRFEGSALVRITRGDYGVKSPNQKKVPVDGVKSPS